jgi:ABC-2 type transport system permease protein
MSAFNMLVKKDLIQYFSNRRAVLVNIVLPIFIGAFFGYVFGGSGDTEMAKIAINVVDLDQSPVSKDIIDHLQSEKQLSVTSTDAPSADALLKSGKITATLTFPAGFGQDASRALFSGRGRPAIKIGIDPSQRLGTEVVRGLLAQDVMQCVTKFAFANTSQVFPDVRKQVTASNLPDGNRRDLMALFDSIDQVNRDNAASTAAAGPAALSSASGAALSPMSGGLKLPYDTEEIVATTHADSKYNSYAHSFAGMGVQFILFMGIDIGIALLTMRRMDIWKRLKAAPLSRATLLGSRAASCAIIALIIFSIIMTTAVLAFGVRIEGSLIGLIALLIVFSMMTATFGLMIAALGRSPEATRGLAMMATLILVMLGGAWVPAFVFPKWLQQLSLVAPTRWAVDGIDAMTWRGLGIESAVTPVAVMLAFTLVFGLVALMRFKWDE